MVNIEVRFKSQRRSNYIQQFNKQLLINIHKETKI